MASRTSSWICRFWGCFASLNKFSSWSSRTAKCSGSDGRLRINECSRGVRQMTTPFFDTGICSINGSCSLIGSRFNTSRIIVWSSAAARTAFNKAWFSVWYLTLAEAVIPISIVVCFSACSLAALKADLKALKSGISVRISSFISFSNWLELRSSSAE